MAMTGNKRLNEFKSLRKIPVFSFTELQGRWLNLDKQTKVNRWDSFVWLTAYWTRVRCTESRSWSDYTADREAKAMLCSVELDPNGPERKEQFSNIYFLPTNASVFWVSLYRDWAQGGTLQPAWTVWVNSVQVTIIIWIFKALNCSWAFIPSLLLFMGY